VNDTYLGNPQVKRDGVQQGWTKQDIQEYQRCMTDPVYFAETYGKVISLDEGLVPFKLYPYQKEMFEHFNDNRFSIVLACRQSGKSISSCMYILWYALFHPDQTIAILANKGATAREMLARITLALENTPFFLQPGTKALNKGSIEFSNNSRIIAAATSGSSIRGLSVNLLFLDEFAFVENAAQFYTSTYPVISSGNTSRVIITSTANGIGNIFHKIYEGAVQGTNEFKPFRVDWWDVPGRDEQWKDQTIANTSELQFQQEFGNTFFGTGNTLISADALMNMKAKPPVSVGDINVYKEPKANHDYIMTVDVAKGRGQDYSTFNIIDISTNPFKQVACYRNNLISPILFPDIIHKWAKRYNEAYVIIESNDQGAVVANGLYYDIEYENMHVESMIKAGAIGMTMNRKVKRIGCSNLKDLIEEKRLHIVDLQTITECSTFEARGNSFEASDGNHDDLVMNLVMFAWYVGTEAFSNQTDMTMKQMLYEEKMKAIEDDITPVGIIDDGVETEKSETIGGDVWFEQRTDLF
jgi:hypothetical protein